VHVLVTGHTGFKGAWLTLLLKQWGHDVSGLALDPEPGSLFETAELSQLLVEDVRCDIRDQNLVRETFAQIAPDFVIHLAAQPLVRASYSRPRETLETNVMGTLAVLEALAVTPLARGALLITTDKVYRNVGQLAGYIEEDPLGGTDPYSASKAMADILIASWASSFPGIPIAIARAGNVIGGGDTSQDRLFPDIVRAFKADQSVRLRYPDAVRPWQHVLDCLSGYALLMDALVDGQGEGSWNFGPVDSSLKSVRDATELAARLWPSAKGWEIEDTVHPHEAGILHLESSKARINLGWRDSLDFTAAIEWTIEWEKRVSHGESPRDVTLEQISRFLSLTGDAR